MSLPEIPWSTLTDDELDELLLLAEAEEQRRWYARRPRSLVDDLRTAMSAQPDKHPEGPER
jgi:hypothetical protein